MTGAPTGLELLRMAAAMPDDQRPASIGDLFGIRFEHIDDGHVEMSLATRDDMRNPLGTLHGGVCATLLDSVVGCAVHTTLPAGVGYATLDNKLIAHATTTCIIHR